MVDPIINALEVWLVIFENLPQPIYALIDLVFFLMFLFFIVRLVGKAGE